MLDEPVLLEAMPGSVAEPAVEPHLVRSVASSASQLFLRRAVITGLSALSTAIVARKIGSNDFGQFSSALATFFLVMSASDLGFSLVLGRELAVQPGQQGPLTRAALQVMSVWAGVLTALTVAMVAVIGLTSTRGIVLLWMTPAVATAGLTGVRQIFLVTYRTRKMAFVDTVSNLGATAVICAVALAGLGVGWIAAATSLQFVANSVWMARVGLRLLRHLEGRRGLLDGQRPSTQHRRTILAQSLPLGIASLLSSAYFTIDMALLGFVVSGPQLGYYAAAVKFLSILVTVPGLVVTAALPGLSVRVQDRDELASLVASIWHWLATVGLPLCAGTAVFAGSAIRIFFGPGYASSVRLLQVLAASAAVALASNLFGTILVAQRRSRWMLVQNALALAGNVTGNILLVPRYGVAAAAWLTLGTEVFVCVGAALAIRRTVSLLPAVRVSASPLLAVTAMMAVGVALGRWPVAAVAGACLAYASVLSITGGWPPEMRDRAACIHDLVRRSGRPGR
jgi:O-antigen/teichoic acid export membrane protein